jgi:hypothetical protein
MLQFPCFGFVTGFTLDNDFVCFCAILDRLEVDPLFSSGTQALYSNASKTSGGIVDGGDFVIASISIVSCYH